MHKVLLFHWEYQDINTTYDPCVYRNVKMCKRGDMYNPQLEVLLGDGTTFLDTSYLLRFGVYDRVKTLFMLQ